MCLMSRIGMMERSKLRSEISVGPSGHPQSHHLDCLIFCQLHPTCINTTTFPFSFFFPLNHLINSHKPLPLSPPPLFFFLFYDLINIIKPTFLIKKTTIIILGPLKCLAHLKPCWDGNGNWFHHINLN